MHRRSSSRKRSWAIGLRLFAAGPLGVAVAIVLVSCGSSGKGLIPSANAGPLQSDFEAVAQAAQAGGGNCTATTEAINKTEQDFAALPVTIDAGLHNRLSQGISNLRERALALCAQPLAQTATTTTPRTTTTTTTTPTTPTTTTSTPTTPTPTPVTPPNNGGGTVAPGEGERETPEPGDGKGHGKGHGKGDEQGESGGVGPGGVGQEGGK
jgi:hypothetical protein